MNTKADKKTLILDAMEKLLNNGNGIAVSVNKIAETAGIGKGSIYYYFKSKEEIAEALILRTYSSFVDNCRLVLEIKGTAIEKLKSLFKVYYSQSAGIHVDEYLHLPHNAGMHQKSLAHIVLSMSPIVSEIIKQGIEEGSMLCADPDGFSEIILTVLAFLFDYGIFEQSSVKKVKRLKAFAEILEKSLSVKKGSFSFLYKNS